MGGFQGLGPDFGNSDSLQHYRVGTEGLNSGQAERDPEGLRDNSWT